MYEIITHIFGVLGLLSVLAAWQFNTRQEIIWLHVIAFTCFAIELYMLGTIVGAVMMGIGAFRTIIANFTQDKRIALAFIFLVLAMGYSQFSVWYDALSIFGAIIGILTFYSPSVSFMRILAPFGTMVWAIHNFYAGAWAQLTADILILCSMAIGAARIFYPKYKDAFLVRAN